MGTVTYHRDDSLRCATEERARAVVKLINDHNDENGGMHADEKPVRVQDKPLHALHGPRPVQWQVKLDDFDGDHLPDMTPLLIALAPLMDSGAFLVIEQEDGERFRIYWNGRGQVFEQTVSRVVWNHPGVELKATVTP